MTGLITNQPTLSSPFRFDTSPNGEADVAPDQIAVLENSTADSKSWGADGFGFKDVLDIINPLQHIPVISSIYRAVTGDEIADAPRALGGAIYGGPVGLLAAVSNSVVKAETGADIGQTALAAFAGSKDTGGATPTGPAQQLASAPVSSRTASPTPVAIPAPTPLSMSAPDAPTNDNPPPGSLIAQLSATPARKAGGFIPSAAAARAGLFGAPPQPRPVSSPTVNPSPHGGHATGGMNGRASPESGSLQSAPANALDRLIARSRAAQAERSTSPAPASLQVPTDTNNVHDWMLRALGKYETMPKG